MSKKRVIIIGAGFGGMSAAAYLARDGHDVTVLEKNSLPGGRANVIKKQGFVFDAGPSWYMMPDVFADFFADFDLKVSDVLRLDRLDPAYQVVTNDKSFHVPSYPGVKQLINKLDNHAGKKFEAFYQQTKHDYHEIRQSVLEKPMQKSSEVLDPKVLKFLAGRDMYRTYQKKIESITDNKDLQHTLEFMSVFMGGSPAQIPAIYSLLAYVDMGLGVFYPQGGFGALAKAFEQVCKNRGVQFKYNQPVQKIITRNGSVTGVKILEKTYECDTIVANADYQFVETKLLSVNDRAYDAKYWRNADVSPSALLFFLGTDRKIPKLSHHNLFFDTDWDGHFDAMKSKRWSNEPLFYVSVPSKTDVSVAPKGMENLFVLAPMPAGVHPTKSQIEKTTNNIMKRLSEHTGIELEKHLKVNITKTSNYFKQTFNAYRGNAFGLSHTLKQSAIFRPKLQSKKVSGLYYAGQYTNPGTGVPMVVLSGKVAAKLVGEDKS